MKKLLLVMSLSVFLFLDGCKKDPSESVPPALAKWVGIYNGPYGSALEQISISYAGNNTLQIVMKVNQYSYLYTATTLKDVSVSGTTATISEVENIIEDTNYGPYQFNGLLTLNADNTLSLSATAVSVRTPANENSPMNFNFQGNKVE
jgi:hypothetical protein